MIVHIDIPVLSFDGFKADEVLASWIKLDLDNMMFYSCQRYSSIEWDVDEKETVEDGKEHFRNLNSVADLREIVGCKCDYSVYKTWLLQLDFKGLNPIIFSIRKKAVAFAAQRTICESVWPGRFTDVFKETETVDGI